MNATIVNIHKLVNKKRFITSNVTEYVEFFLLCTIAIAIPLLIRHPQLVVGISVNLALILTAVNIKGWFKVIPLIMLPSIAALAAGFLFGSFTLYLVYLLPVIWLGNASLVLLMKYLYVHREVPFLLSVPIAAVLKMTILFVATFLFVLMGILPEIFLSIMGIMQFSTALIAGFIAFPVTLIYKKIFTVSKAKQNSLYL